MPENNDFLAFTIKYDGLSKRILTDLVITNVAIDQPAPDGSDQLKTNALWDTGATGSVITASTAKTLNLTVIGQSKMNTAGGLVQCNSYVVNFFLPHRVAVIGVKVTECPDGDGSFGAIIGMDIIIGGDLSITNVDKKTWMSFRYPSIKRIDYVEEANRLLAAGIGRNDPCFCGRKSPDGRPVKYKNCHGKNA